MWQWRLWRHVATRGGEGSVWCCGRRKAIGGNRRREHNSQTRIGRDAPDGLCCAVVACLMGSGDRVDVASAVRCDVAYVPPGETVPPCLLRIERMRGYAGDELGAAGLEADRRAVRADAGIRLAGANRRDAGGGDHRARVGGPLRRGVGGASAGGRPGLHDAPPARRPVTGRAARPGHGPVGGAIRRGWARCGRPTWASSACCSSSGKATCASTRGARLIPGTASPNATPSSWRRWCSPVMLIDCWQHSDRSLTKAAQAIQGHAPHLAATFATHPQLCQALQTMARCLAAAGRLNKRQAAPPPSRPSPPRR